VLSVFVPCPLLHWARKSTLEHRSAEKKASS
jgi:hypothetical protein